MSDRAKKIYEGLQVVNALLDETGEQLLVGLVEEIREGLRAEEEDPLHTLDGDSVEQTLKSWVDFEARYNPED